MCRAPLCCNDFPAGHGSSGHLLGARVWSCSALSSCRSRLPARLACRCRICRWKSWRLSWQRAAKQRRGAKLPSRCRGVHLLGGAVFHVLAKNPLDRVYGLSRVCNE